MAGKSVPPGLQRTDLDLDSEQGVFVMPGDEFTIPKDSNKLILGPGLRSIMDPVTKQPVKIVSCKAGILKKTKPNTFFIELKTRSYQNYKNDDIVGVIKQKSKGEHYAIDIACREHRTQLSKNAFEGATKRYRPDLQVGDVVFGKVLDYPKDFPLELTCVQPSGKSDGLGSLSGGHIFHVPVHFVRFLRTPDAGDNLLVKIGKVVPLETAVGLNGLVWIKSKNAVLTILVTQLIQTLSKVPANEYDGYVKKFRNALVNSGYL